MKKVTTTLVLCFGLLQQIYAQDKTVFSLAEAEQFSVENSQTIKNAQLDLEASEKKIWETIAIGLPQINADAKFNHFLDIPTSVVDATLFNPAAPPGSVAEFQMGQTYSMSAALNANQLIFDGSYIVGLQFTKFYQKMIQTSIEKTTSETKMMVREAYYNTLVAKRNVRLMDSIQASTKTIWDQTKVFYDNGFILKEDLDQIELTYNRISVSKATALNQFEIAKYLLKLQMGYNLDQSIELTENLNDVIDDIILNNPSLESFSFEKNFDYVLSNQQMELDEYSLKNEKAKYLPSLGAFFQHSQNAFSNDFDQIGNQWYPTTVWGIGLTVPITSSGQKMMRVQQAQIKVEQDKNNLENVERGLKFQELQLKASFTNAFEKMLLEEENIELANSIYIKAINRKKEGTANALNVTQMQNQLLQAEGSYINAVMQMLNYKIELDKLYNN
jgi:outer membrane protein TolC